MRTNCAFHVVGNMSYGFTVSKSRYGIRAGA